MIKNFLTKAANSAETSKDTPTGPFGPNTASTQDWRAKLTSKKNLLMLGIIVCVVILSGVTIATKLHTTPAKKSSQTVATTKRAPRATPPQLTISSPDDQAQITESSVTVTGNVSSDSKVSVDGTTATLSGEGFSATINLSPGTNTVTIVATGPDGGKTTRSIVVTRNNPAQGVPSITLTGNYGYALQSHLSWSASNVDTSKGFYILRSTSPHPTYPTDLVATNPDGGDSLDQALTLDGTQYYYEVCQIAANGGCGIYSNQLPILAQVASSGESITITNVNGPTITWSQSNGQGGFGFILLWSLTPNPTYPSTGVTVYDDAGLNAAADAGTIDHDFISGNTYYVRVCENLGGACGSYSNQATVTAP